MKKFLSLLAIMVVLAALFAFGASATAAGEKVLLRDTQYGHGPQFSTLLTGLGYDVTLVTSLPADVSGYDVLWLSNCVGNITPTEQAQIVAFINNGGGVMFNNDNTTCGADLGSTTDADVQAMLNAVVAAGGIQVGTGNPVAPYYFAAGAKDGITTTPNTLVAFPAASPGIAGGFSGNNILAVDDNGVPMGGVWDEADMASGCGRATLLMDINWDDDIPASNIADNIMTFLLGATCGAVEVEEGAPVPFVGTYDVGLVGAAEVNAVSVGDSLLWSFTISNEHPTLTTFGLSFRADVPDALTIDEVLITAGSGAVRPLEDGVIWADLDGLLAGEAAVVQIETTVVHASEVCITGAVVDVVYDACVTVYPGELPATGEALLLWTMIR